MSNTGTLNITISIDREEVKSLIKETIKEVNEINIDNKNIININNDVDIDKVVSKIANKLRENIKLSNCCR